MTAHPTRLLITVAHPDDETFGTGSIIASSVAAGADVTVCCATHGEAGEAHGLAADADIGAVRESELRAAGRLLGVSRIIMLAFADSGMTGDAGTATLAGAPFNDVVRTLHDVVTDVNPHVVVTLGPEHGDGHRDHTVIGRATVTACHDRPDTRVYAWVLERSLLARWFHELETLRPGSGHLDLDRDGLGRPAEQITTVLDVSDVRPLREQAITIHASQISPYDGMPADLRDQFLSTDRLVRLQPPRRGTPPERTLF